MKTETSRRLPKRTFRIYLYYFHISTLKDVTRTLDRESWCDSISFENLLRGEVSDNKLRLFRSGYPFHHTTILCLDKSYFFNHL